MAEALARRADVVVVGGGPAGLAAAIGLARAGFGTVLLAPEAPADHRTSALLAGSVAFLDAIGVWPRLADAEKGRLRAMRLVDATGRLIRAPEVTFHASEVGLAEFGWNIRNADLRAAMHGTAAVTTGLTRVTVRATAITLGEACAKVDLEDGSTVEAGAVLAADGRNSLARAAAGIGVRQWQYRQSAIVAELRHEAPHHDTSTEFHTKAGPFTLVPLGPRRSSLVWVERPDRADALARLEADAFAREAERVSSGLLGTLALEGPIQTFPLAGLAADALAARRTVLVGETAHQIPPIGAQGLNLGLRDAETAVAVFASARRRPDDLGGAATLARYAELRRADVWSRTMAVDLFGRSLLTSLLPIQAGRAMALAALERFEPLRRFVIHQGLGPARPSLTTSTAPAISRPLTRA